MAAPISYIDYDYDALLLQLQNRLKIRDAWKDIYQSATGSMLIELFAAVGTLVLYYIERRAEESYIATAKNRSSIINLARLLNYIPSRVISSTGTLRFTLATAVPAGSSPVIIPKYTSCSSSEYNFLVFVEGAINVGQTYIDVPGIQGTKIVKSISSSGALNQEYNIADTQIEDSSLVVTVTGVGTTTVTTWTQVTSFISAINTSTDFVLRPELDDTVTIVFGNNVFGKAPTVGDIINITYIKSDGAIGNVYSLATITNLNSTITSDGIIQDITVSNSSVFLGGDDIETTEEIRENAPAVFATGDRLVTKSDFIAVLNAYPQIGDSIAWGEAEEATPDYTHYNQVKLAIILDNWLSPDNVFKATLSDYLYEKSLMTVRYTFIDPVILEVIPTLIIKCVLGSSLSYVQSLVEVAISNQFVLGNTTKLGVSHREGDIIAAIEEVNGVSYSHMTLKIRKELLATYDSTYNWSEEMDVLPLLPGGVEIYINDTNIAIDDGEGTFTDLSSTYTITGVVDYDTGVVGVDISPSPGITDTVYCRYQQDKLGDIEVGMDQIVKWVKNDYTSISYVS